MVYTKDTTFIAIANHLSGRLMLAVSGYWPKVITGSLHRLSLLPLEHSLKKTMMLEKDISFTFSATQKHNGVSHAKFEKKLILRN